jgi:hypothetical protein
MYEWDGKTKPDLVSRKKEESEIQMQSTAIDTTKIVDSKESMKQMAKAKTPKKSCKHCYGTGFIGKNPDTGEQVRCKCTS